MSELGQFSASSITLPGADRRAIMSMSQYTLLEIWQDGIDGPIAYGYVLKPRQAITDNGDHTITLQLDPLTVECTWRRTKPGWVASTFLSTVAQRLAMLVPGWTASIAAGEAALTTAVSVSLNNPTVLGGFLSTAKKFNQYVRLGADRLGAPTRILELGQFGAAPTVTLVSGNGGAADAMHANPTVRLAATVERSPNDVEALVNVCVPYGGGRDADSLVDLERLWRIINDPAYVNYGRWGTDAQSLARTGETSLFPEYDARWPISDPENPPNGYTQYVKDGTTYNVASAADLAYVQAIGATLLQGASGTRGFSMQGRGLYMVYDRDSYLTYGYREGQYTDSSLTYADTSVANQELTARALYVAMTAVFQRYAQPHHSFTCTADGVGRPTRAGDLIAVDYQHTSVDDLGAVVEMDVTTNLRVMKIVRSFTGENPPIDTYTLSNLSRFEDDDATGAADTQRQIVALQRNEGTGLGVLLPHASGNADALHPLVYRFSRPQQLYTWQGCSLRVTFGAYRATAQTATNSDATINLSIPQRAITFPAQQVGLTLPDHTHGVSLPTTDAGGPGAISVNPTLRINPGRGTGKALYQAQANQAWIEADGGFAQAVNLPAYVIESGRFVHSHSISGVTATGGAGAISMTLTGSSATLAATSLTTPLPQHTHALDQRIPDGPTAPACSLAINGVGVSSGLKLRSGTRNSDGTFAGSFEIDDLSAMLNALTDDYVEIRVTPTTGAGNPYGVGWFDAAGTFVAELGGLSSTVTAS